MATTYVSGASRKRGCGASPTVSAIALDDAAHTHRRSTLEQSPGYHSIGSRDGFAAASDGQDTIVHALHHFANTRLDARLIA